MGGSSCLGLSFVEFKLKWLEYRFRACGLRPQLVHLMDSNNTTIHCWVPWRRTGTNNKSEEEGDDEEEEDDDDEEACGGIGSVPENNKRKKKTKKKKKPALMLLHGFAPNALLCWENQIAAFVRDFDVYVPDLLFFGNSTTTQQREEQGEEKQRQRWSEAFQAECLMHMLQVLGVQQKQKKKKNNSSSQQQQQQELHVLGTSYGGMVAFRMAELYPTLVSKVVFSSSGICMSPTNNDELLARNNLSHVSQMLLPSTVQQMRVGVATAIYKQNRIPDFLLRDFVEVLYEENRAERKQLLDDMVIGTPEAFPLPQLTQENFLVVWGEFDEIFKISLAYELQKHLGTQRAEMVVIKNCGHAPQIENPREYNRIILNFLQSPAEKSTKD